MKKKYFLISHNEYALGLKKALEMIVGEQANLTAYGLMPGGHPDDIANEIEKQIDDETQVVILGDIAGGSVCNSCLPLTTKPNVVLVTGTNLPLAMEIVVAQISDKQAIDTIIAACREGMRTLTLELSNEDGGDDFF